MLKKALLPFLMLFYLFASNSSLFAQWKIKIKECAVVKGDWVIFKEIARPTPYCSLEEWKKLKDIKLWKSPPKNRHQIIDQNRLKWLMEYYLGPFSNFCILPNQLVIQRGGRLISKTKLFQMINEKVKKKFAGKEYKIREIKLPDYVFLKEEESKICCKIEPKLKPGPNRVIFTVLNFYKDVKRKIAGSFFLDLWDNVICAARPLNIGDTISPEDITYRKKNLAYLPFKVWDGKGGPWRVKRPIGVGQVIYQKDLEPKPLVLKNQKIFLVYETRFIFLRVPAKALEDGSLGDFIKVMNLQSKRVVIAKIVDKNKVIIPLMGEEQ